MDFGTTKSNGKPAFNQFYIDPNSLHVHDVHFEYEDYGMYTVSLYSSTQNTTGLDFTTIKSISTLETSISFNVELRVDCFHLVPSLNHSKSGQATLTLKVDEHWFHEQYMSSDKLTRGLVELGSKLSAIVDNRTHQNPVDVQWVLQFFIYAV